jgi:hypothetical protein
MIVDASCDGKKKGWFHDDKQHRDHGDENNSLHGSLWIVQI